MEIKSLSLLNNNDLNSIESTSNLPQYTLYILEVGTLNYMLGAQHYTLESQTALIKLPNMQYSINSISTDGKGYKIDFVLSQEEEDQFNINFFKIYIIKKVTPRCLKILEELSENNKSVGINHILNQHLFSAILYLVLSENTTSKTYSAVSNNYVQLAIQYMSRRIYEKISLDDIADEIVINKHHFLRLFKKTTNLSPMNYFAIMKINKAAELLTTTLINVSELSIRLGFSSDAHFSKTFNKYMGETPSSYKNKYMQHQSSSSSKNFNPNNQNSLMQTIIDASPDIIFYKSIEGVILGCNTALCRIMGMGREELIGKTDDKLFPKEEADFYREKDLQVINSERSVSNIEWMTYPDGTTKKFEVVKSPFYIDGELAGLVGVSRDITNI